MGGIVGRFMNSFGITMAVRHRGVAAGLLHPDADDVARAGCAPTQPEGELAHRRRKPTRRARLLRLHRAGLSRLLDWSLAHRWVDRARHDPGVFVSTVPLFMAVNKNFLPHGRRVAVRGQGARAGRRRASRPTQTIAESIAARVRKIPGVDGDAASPSATTRSAPRTSASIYVSSEPVDERKLDQFADHGQGPHRTSCRSTQRLNLRTQVAPVNAFGGGINAEIMFWIGGPDLDQLEQVLADAHGEASRTHARRGRRRHQPDRRQARAGRADRPRQGRRPRRPRPGHRLDAQRPGRRPGGDRATTEGGEQYEVHVRAERERPAATRQGIAQAEVPSIEGGHGAAARRGHHRRTAPARR